MNATGGIVIRAGKWGLRQVGNPRPPTETVASTASPMSLTLPLPRRSTAFSTTPLLSADISNVTPTSHVSDDVVRSSSVVAIAPTEVEYQQKLVPSPPSLTTSGSPSGDGQNPTDGKSPILLEDEASAPPPGAVEDPASGNSQQRPDSALLSEPPSGKCSPSSHRCVKNETSSPSTTSRALTAALACARGIGGRLGTPLGSPYPAPGEDWATGCSVSASACAAARTAKRSESDIKSSTPGSRFFPPFAAAGTPAISPVVFEMVQDAADDEEDAAATAAVAAVDSGTATRGEGWQGLTLYRWGATDRR